MWFGNGDYVVIEPFRSPPVCRRERHQRHRRECTSPDQVGSIAMRAPAVAEQSPGYRISRSHASGASQSVRIVWALMRTAEYRIVLPQIDDLQAQDVIVLIVQLTGRRAERVDSVIRTGLSHLSGGAG
ncbi:hypothetical protein ACCAA_1170013 [Candidatus Accumulibacter aalborgensis]|uniref:Uncharacterized protein n=1 Tax=Candidatus Accumulibacter aalborgensis TaxID=1860102 RepID=A0A1A8XGN6_9PROT|nr:hypothetical protein ACCAA_1170013 [Candidatus Accumulibacter aalborgensis]